MKDSVCVRDFNQNYKECAVGGDYSQSLLARGTSGCGPTENENGTL